MNNEINELISRQALNDERINSGMSDQPIARKKEWRKQLRLINLRLLLFAAGLIPPLFD